MDLAEEIFRDAANVVGAGDTIMYQGQEISIKAPFARLTMDEALQKWGNISIAD